MRHSENSMARVWRTRRCAIVTGALKENVWRNGARHTFSPMAHLWRNGAGFGWVGCAAGHRMQKPLPMTNPEHVGRFGLNAVLTRYRYEIASSVSICYR